MISDLGFQIAELGLFRFRISDMGFSRFGISDFGFGIASIGDFRLRISDLFKLIIRSFLVYGFNSCWSPAPGRWLHDAKRIGQNVDPSESSEFSIFTLCALPYALCFKRAINAAISSGTGDSKDRYSFVRGWTNPSCRACSICLGMVFSRSMVPADRCSVFLFRVLKSLRGR